ncbi:MAG: two-component regulator propeller domain-containing protein [bacterium]
MFKFKLVILTNLIFICSTVLWAQQSIGEWTTHISYNSITNMAQSEDMIYVLSSGALFSVNKYDLTTETYSSIEGLSDNTINTIKYSDEVNALFIAYENSNIDLLYDNGDILNINDIYYKTTNSSKTINDIYFYGDFAYLSCDFGIVKINIEKQEISDTYYLGDDGEAAIIYNTVIVDNAIYACKSDDILCADLDEGNLLNYQNWNSLASLDSLDSINGNIKMIADGDDIYVLKSDGTLYMGNNGDWKQYSTNTSDILVENGVVFLKSDSSYISAYEDVEIEDILGETLVYALYDKDKNTIWVANSTTITSLNLKTNSMNNILMSGPGNNTAWRIKTSNGRVFVIPGGRWASNYYTAGSISIYENYEWWVHTSESLSQHSPANNCFDFIDIIADPSDNTRYWVASFGLGLYEFRNDEFYELYTVDNSTIETSVASNPYVYMRIDGLAYDSEGNLWFTNRGLKYVDPSGNFYIRSYTDIDGQGTIQDIVFDNQNEDMKYVLLPRYTSAGGVAASLNSYFFVIDDNGTISDESDDTTLGFNSFYDQDGNELKLTEYQLQCIAQDDNGTIWLGTTQGPILLENTSNIFNYGYQATKVKISRDDGSGLADYLLVTESINDIAIDGANRKWLATESGAYLLSEDGKETIYHFTTENSPLLSNSVQSVGIVDETGEVFFGTANGIISYQSDAVASGTSFDNVHAYPNPVRPEYYGTITITGLVTDTRVKITDIKGYLIYETVSNGSIATWDGCRSNGERVASGVYFAHCISPDKKEKAIAKILIINH